MFDKIKRFFDLKIYSKKQVRQFCDKGVISPDEYKAITEEEYNEKATPDSGEV